MIRVFLSFFVLFISSELFASFSGQGEISLEYRRFEKDKKETTEDSAYSVFTRIDSRYEEGNFLASFRGFARVDEKDHDRDLIALEDTYASYRFGSVGEWKILGGYKIFNWSATEAFHPADVINSRNFDSNIENMEKKGELTVELEREVLSGSLSFYLFPRFEEPHLPGSRSRLGSSVDFERPIVVDGDDTSSNERWNFQWGTKFSQIVGDADVSFHFLHHINRLMPLIGTNNYGPVLGTIIPLDTRAIPFFYWVNQVGGTYQQAFGPVLLKFEGAYRDFENAFPVYTTKGLRTPKDHTELAFGLEYVWGHANGSESNLFLEGQTIVNGTKSRRAEMSVLQRDILLGWRYAFNDLMGKEIFLSAIADVERSREYIFNMSYSQRLSDTWKIKTGIRVHEAPQKKATREGLEYLDGDSYYFLTFTRYF